jgi:hypothetical protein
MHTYPATLVLTLADRFTLNINTAVIVHQLGS